ncbi:MAG: type II toxin-antitoxin system HicB family antitoxin [Acidobacteria bacterium]|nr:type II toxin-antitoxin system HicB family antitoxin [Acidobacteriota bacterium]MYF77221.1 type II toxin-antitoxin system HicB family antitoxin [Acidobacteriota bacterium]
MQMVRTEAGNPFPTIHADVVECEAWLVAECRELGVVTQGRTLDETVTNLRQALVVHLDGEESDRVAASTGPRLVVHYETTAFSA